MIGNHAVNWPIREQLSSLTNSDVILKRFKVNYNVLAQQMIPCWKDKILNVSIVYTLGQLEAIEIVGSPLFKGFDQKQFFAHKNQGLHFSDL